jgi:hypothetical protein
MFTAEGIGGWVRVRLRGAGSTHSFEFWGPGYDDEVFFAEDIVEISVFESELSKSGQGTDSLDEGNLRCYCLVAFVRLEHGEVTGVMAWPKEDVFALRDAEHQPQGLAHFMVRPLLSGPDINEAEKGLGATKRSGERLEIIRALDDAAAL